MAVTQTRKLKRGPNKGDTVRVRAKSKSALAKGDWYPVAVSRDTGSKNQSRVGKASRRKKGRSKKR